MAILRQANPAKANGVRGSNFRVESTRAPRIGKRCGFAALLLLAATAAHAQWDIATPPTTADLRGIDNVGKGVAWASGANGTVVRTEDDGFLWQRCSVPPGAEHLDFRGIQAFDADTAIVMSSGKGDLSRLYKTIDGCQTWTLLFTNPDPEGFWDAIQFNVGDEGGISTSRWGTLIGDPVAGRFVEFGTSDGGEHWARYSEASSVPAQDGEAIFAASNSSLLYLRSGTVFVTGGVAGGRSRTSEENLKHDPRVSCRFIGGDIPLGRGNGSGAFSVATSTPAHAPAWNEGLDVLTAVAPTDIFVAVGGNYLKPGEEDSTAAWSSDGTKTWLPARTTPHGYRSAVAYDTADKTWITVGPNGTDISTDDGRNWRALKPTPTSTGTHSRSPTP
jgi:photosystem II stability/assembly factor-like uncharacterized protein